MGPDKHRWGQREASSDMQVIYGNAETDIYGVLISGRERGGKTFSQDTFTKQLHNYSKGDKILNKKKKKKKLRGKIYTRTHTHKHLMHDHKGTANIV